MDQRNLISAMIFFLLASCVILTSLGLGVGSPGNPQTGFMPFWTGMLVLIFSLILFALAYKDKSVAVRWSDVWHKIHWQKTVASATAIAAYIALLPWFGFLIATCMLMVILFMLGQMKIWRAALCAVCSVGFTYGLFHYLIKTPLPRGIWGF